MSRKEDEYVDIVINVKYVFKNVHKTGNPLEEVEETFIGKMKQALRYGGAGNDRLFGLSDVLFGVGDIVDYSFDVDCRGMEKMEDGLFMDDKE